jgi:uncharacterized cupredoxin-like copper-binding protein
VQVTAEDTEGYRFVLSRSSVGSEAGSLPNTLPGAHPQLKLDLSAGSYTLFCSLPGHEAKGMKATLIVN